MIENSAARPDPS